MFVTEIPDTHTPILVSSLDMQNALAQWFVAVHNREPYQYVVTNFMEFIDLSEEEIDMVDNTMIEFGSWYASWPGNVYHNQYQLKGVQP